MRCIYIEENSLTRAKIKTRDRKNANLTITHKYYEV